jgi:hypothetical protein
MSVQYLMRHYPTLFRAYLVPMAIYPAQTLSAHSVAPSLLFRVRVYGSIHVTSTLLYDNGFLMERHPARIRCRAVYCRIFGTLCLSNRLNLPQVQMEVSI